MRIKTFIAILLVVTAFSFFSSASFADTETSGATNEIGRTYGGFQYSMVNYKESGFDKANPSMLVGNLGKNFNKYLSVEGRLGFGISSDTVGYSFYKLRMEIETLFGLYGLARVDVSQASSIYALIGASQIKAKVSGFGASSSSSESGLSYGVGGDIGITNNITLNIEYTNYLDKSDFTLSAFGLGVKYYF